MSQGNASWGVPPQQAPPQQPPATQPSQAESPPPADAETEANPPAKPPAQPQPVPEVPPVQQQVMPFDEQTSSPPAQVQQPGLAEQPTPAEQAAAEKPSILTCLRDFAKQAECDRYAADGERIKLIIDYLWMRQLTPTLPFETFLGLYTPLANFDAMNLKHPAEAIKALLPRTKKAAEATKAHQWSAKEVVEFVALYIDIVRESESQCVPVPMDFRAFLENGQMQEQYLAGAFKEAAPPKKSGGAGGGKKPAVAAEPVRPTAVNQRVIYTGPTRQQHRGVVDLLTPGTEEGKSYVDFTTDAGEKMVGLGIHKFAVIDDPPPNPPQALDGEALPLLGSGTITIKKAQLPAVQQALAIKGQPMGNVAETDVIYPFTVQVAEGISAHVDVINGKEGPYVDPFLVRGGDMDHPIVDLPPRDNIIGTYTFVTAEGAYNVEVKANE